MNKLFFFVAALLICNISFGQEEPEEPVRSSTMGGEGTLTFANSNFGEYWSGGGLGSTNIGGILNTYLNNTYESKATWDNNLRIDYGLSKVENTNGDEFVKSSDVFDFISKYGIPFKNNDAWSYSAAFNLLTQLTGTDTGFDEATQGFSELIGINEQPVFGQTQSNLFSPADISLGLGVNYKPNDHFSAFYGPASVKLRVVGDDLIAASGLFGNDIVLDAAGNVTSFDNTRFEAGSSAIANYQNTFLDNDILSFATGLKLFSNYIEDPANVDVNWNTITSLNPWKFVTITYSTDLAYDDNKAFTNFANGEVIGTVDRGTQWRSVLGIGLIHKFGASTE